MTARETVAAVQPAHAWHTATSRETYATLVRVQCDCGVVLDFVDGKFALKDAKDGLRNVPEWKP